MNYDFIYFLKILFFIKTKKANTWVLATNPPGMINEYYVVQCNVFLYCLCLTSAPHLPKWNQ